MIPSPTKNKLHDSTNLFPVCTSGITLPVGLDLFIIGARVLGVAGRQRDVSELDAARPDFAEQRHADHAGQNKSPTEGVRDEATVHRAAHEVGEQQRGGEVERALGAPDKHDKRFPEGGARSYIKISHVAGETNVTTRFCHYGSPLLAGLNLG
jgi:hypothetical protein